MKNLIIILVLVLSTFSTQVWADENVDNTNSVNPAFGPNAIPIPVRLNILGEFNHNTPFIAPENRAPLESHFYPSFLINAGSGSSIFSLSKVDSLDEGNKLKLSKNDDGYIYIKSTEIEVGFGIKGAISAGLGFSVGLEPYFGKGKSETRFVESKDKKYLKELKSLEVPENKEILDQWIVGEKLSYFKKGGIQFTASAGYSLVGATVGYAAEGIWKVILEKVSENKLVAHLRQVKLHSLKLGVSTLTPSASLFKYWKFDEDFSFIFDFRDVKAIETLKDMLTGSMKKVQEIAENLDVDSVKALTQENKSISGHTFWASFIIPGVFSAKILFGHDYENSKNLYFAKGLKIETWSGENSRYADTSGALSRSYTRYNLFDGNVAAIEKLEDEGDKKIVTWGHYHYQFARDKFTGDLLNKEIKKMHNIIGYYDQIKLDAPKDGEFGHVKLQVDAVISNPATVKIVSREEIIGKDEFLSQGQSIVKTYFSSNIHADKICNKRVKKKFCERYKTIQTKVYLKRAHNQLKKMKASWKKKDYKAFSKSYARLGKSLTKNLFTFKVLRDLFGRENIKMFLSVQGDEVARFQKEIRL
jgi:hypothetical protein